MYTDITHSTLSTGSSISSTIYIPEAEIIQGGTSGDSKHTERTAIIVSGSYDGNAESYYRLDFISSNKILLNALRTISTSLI